MRRAFLLISITGVLLCRSLSAGTLEFELSSYAIAENASSFEVAVSRSGNVSAAATVTVISIDGTAVASKDFLNISVVLSWTAGDTLSKKFSITIIDNAIVDGSLNFQLELINPSGDTLGTVATTLVTISDFEEGQLALSAASYSISENDEVVMVTVSRTIGTNGEVSVSIATKDGTASKDSDYESVETTLVFADGEALKTISIPLVDDNIGEVDETFSIELSSVTGGATIGEIQTATITIEDTDLDFTPLLTTLSLVDDNITQPPLIDLKQASLLDATKTFLETINEIPVLKITDLVAEQDSSGIITIAVGDDKYYLRPIAVTRAVSGFEPLIIIYDDKNGRFVTSQGLNFEFQPALKGLSILQEKLAEVSLPELEVTANGNITIQVDQGPPPLELNAAGVLEIHNSYFDRYNVRPISVGTLSTATTEDIALIAHPSFPDEALLVVTFRDESDFRQQVLTPAPYDGLELVDYLNIVDGLSNVVLGDYGLVNLKYGTEAVTLFSDYIVRRAENFVSSKVGVVSVADMNGDGRNDIKMTYSSGDEQYFFVMQPP